MITSRNELKYYIEADRIALYRKKKTIADNIYQLIRPDYIWKFQKLLRKCEYYKNTKERSAFRKLFYIIYKLKLIKLSVKLGFSIPENVFGPGLAIVHYGTIIVNAEAKVGANCRIHACTNIGQSGGMSGAPVIGDNVYIGPGAKIFGKISIANNIAIAANAAVSKSFYEEGILIGGIPAAKIKAIDISTIIKHIKT